ncbi:response regulator [Noviherbaspirillum sp. Root189]|uniref:response regulator n=1 Tax=Noviherbaspirillum sp. Root189 TaxID=1736487 RepID=UPI000708D8FD|nr:response regulator [Noviherbaspirillum sp. Root189]KRB87629.1 hypothetical protein ASE07_19810 [Noviherbaspirillum sp. Root189]
MTTLPTYTHAPVVLPQNRKPNQAGLILNGKQRDFSRSGTNSYKVLLVDDNVDLLDLAAVLFRQLGFEVHTATSGDEALEILRDTPDFDLLFTDVVMPGINGIQLGHETRKLYPSMKIILVSGYPQEAISAGHGSIYDFAFLSKPYRLEEIVKLLKEGS